VTVFGAARFQHVTEAFDRAFHRRHAQQFAPPARYVTELAGRSANSGGPPLHQCYRVMQLYRPDGSFWYAHRVAHVTLKVVYAFPDDDFPERTRSTDDPISAGMNNTPKYVVSTTLDNVDEWQNSTLIKGNVLDELNELKQQPSKNLTLIGSATLIRSLLQDGVIDELLLLVFPLVVGAGQRLFADYPGRLPLSLLDSRSFGPGVVKLVYVPAEK
jgi:dihydrofolate reductase